jgi:hypothetical protein
MGAFVVQGIRHILFGADHMLFVLGLLLIVKDCWMLLKTITAFTEGPQHHARDRYARIRRSSSTPVEFGHRPQHLVSRC